MAWSFRIFLVYLKGCIRLYITGFSRRYRDLEGFRMLFFGSEGLVSVHRIGIRVTSL